MSINRISSGILTRGIRRPVAKARCEPGQTAARSGCEPAEGGGSGGGGDQEDDGEGEDEDDEDDGGDDDEEGDDDDDEEAGGPDELAESKLEELNEDPKKFGPEDIDRINSELVEEGSDHQVVPLGGDEGFEAMTAEEADEKFGRGWETWVDPEKGTLEVRRFGEEEERWKEYATSEEANDRLLNGVNARIAADPSSVDEDVVRGMNDKMEELGSNFRFVVGDDGKLIPYDVSDFEDEYPDGYEITQNRRGKMKMTPLEPEEEEESLPSQVGPFEAAAEDRPRSHLKSAAAKSVDSAAAELRALYDRVIQPSTTYGEIEGTIWRVAQQHSLPELKDICRRLGIASMPSGKADFARRLIQRFSERKGRAERGDEISRIANLPAGKGGRRGVVKDVEIIEWRGRWTVARPGSARPLIESATFSTPEAAERWAESQGWGRVTRRPAAPRSRLT